MAPATGLWLLPGGAAFVIERRQPAGDNDAMEKRKRLMLARRGLARRTAAPGLLPR